MTTSTVESASITSTKALIASLCHRYLLNFSPEGVDVRRSPENLVFAFDIISTLNNVHHSLAETLEYTILNIVKNATNETRLTLQEEDIDFSHLYQNGTGVLPFTKYMENLCPDAPLPEFLKMAKSPALRQLLELLYTETSAGLRGARLIGEFPTIMAGKDVDEGGSQRCDFLLNREVLARLYSVGSEEEDERVGVSFREDKKRDMFGRKKRDSTSSSSLDAKCFDEENHKFPQNDNNSYHKSSSVKARLYLNSHAFAVALHSFATFSTEEVLPESWRFKTFSLNDAPEIIRTIYIKLIEYWRGHTHTDKLKVACMTLMLIVSDDVKSFVTKQLFPYNSQDNAAQLFRIDKAILEKCVELCTKWKNYLSDLTEKDLVDWDSGPCLDGVGEGPSFLSRLTDVIRMRSLYDTTESLVGANSEALLHIGAEEMFEGKRIIDIKAASHIVWDRCVSEFHHQFSLIEAKLAGQIKGLLSGAQGESKYRLMADYSILLQCDSIRNFVSADLEQFQTSLLEGAKSSEARLRKEISIADPVKTSDVRRATHKCMAEVGKIIDLSRGIFGVGTEAAAAIEKVTAKVMEQAFIFEMEWIKKWVTIVEERCQKLTLLKSAVTVTCETKATMKAETKATKPNISNILTIMTCVVAPVIQELADDVNTMRAYANGSASISRPPIRTSFSSACQNTLDEVEKMIKCTIKTRRLISCFNSIMESIIPETKLMMVEGAQKAVSIFVSGYPQNTQRKFPLNTVIEINMLNKHFQTIIESLDTQNRSIRKTHLEVRHRIMSLFDIDLQHSVDQWKSTLKALRLEFLSLEQSLASGDAGIDKAEKMYEWRRFWDAQIYKALEYQYQRGLETLNENLQEFSLDVIFKQAQIQFKPSLEAVREAYFIKIREFVSIPLRFKGVGNSEFFSYILSRNKNAIAAVYQQAVEIFNKIARVRKQFGDLVVVGICGINGAPDLDYLIDKLVKTKEDWEAGFRVVEERNKRLTYVSDSIKINCVTISFVPVKASISDHLHKLEESLTEALQKHMKTCLEKIDIFVIYASNSIEKRPSTLEEVGEVKKAYAKFKEQIPLYQIQLTEINGMKKLVKEHAGATPFEMSVTLNRWEHLMDAMESYHDEIQASVGHMKVSMDAMITKYLKDFTKFANKWHKMKPQDFKVFKTREDFIEKGLNYVREQVLEIEELETQGKGLLTKCEHFGLTVPNFSIIDVTKQDIMSHKKMWGLYEEFEKELDELRTEDWLTFRARTYVFVDFLKSWEEQIQEYFTKEVESNGGNLVVSYLRKQMEQWMDTSLLFKYVSGEGMLPEHWNEMFRLLGVEKGMTSDKLTFGDILNHSNQLIQNHNELASLHGRAQGEVQIRTAVQELRNWAMDATLTLVTPAEYTTGDGNIGGSSSGTSKQVKLISEWKDAMTQVSDNQALVASLKDSPYYPRFADEVGGWESRLASVAQYLVLLNNIQQKWVYLEPLLAHGALPNEAPRFKKVDMEFVGILRDIGADPRIMSVDQHTDYSEKLHNILAQIDRCQKALKEYLEQKRDIFPRFYFLSDEDLLEILGQGKNLRVIETHLKKLFMGIHSVEYDEGQSCITHMVSAEGEVVPLTTHVSTIEKSTITSTAGTAASSSVENWLKKLDVCMKGTLQTLLEKCIAGVETTKHETINQYPSQVLQVAEEIFFARIIEQAIPSGKLKDYHKELQKQLEQLTCYNVPDVPIMEVKVRALILECIHHIDIVELLMRKRVKNNDSWWWQKQLRYYWDSKAKSDEKSKKQSKENGDSRGWEKESVTYPCVVKMADTCFPYTFEYQGNARKLVYTPLTDKCYLVLMTGMQLGYGGNPYGPAGTGKTESVKALGSALGRQVLVFNCDEGIDFKGMGRIFMGIVKCGAWGCFDEFNRLKIDQLSAISQMIQVIQEGLKNREPVCQLLDRSIELNPHSGIFVTLNPAGKGYGGRTHLPDNLKQLFRAVAMSIPDEELIASTMLQSEGFLHSKAISKRLIDVYSLCKQLMSSQKHYNWGLRPLKAVLGLAGFLLRQYREQDRCSKKKSETPLSQSQELEFIVQSLRVNTLSKLTFDDCRLFNGLMMDIFPNVATKEISYNELDVTIKAAIEDLHLQYIDTQVKHVLQLYEAMNQRMGVALVGPSGSGKSTLIKILRRALQRLNIEVQWHICNPKALPRQQLLGYMDPDTREWFDGIISTAARKIIKEPPEVRSWVYCDGDIDPEWVESLNSVLDDNKLLTMPNGIRIQFGSNVNFIFETDSLQSASPATVSRMGIIFLPEEDIDTKHVVESFLGKHLTPPRRKLLEQWVNEYFYKALNLLSKQKDSLVVETTRMGLVNIALSHIEGAETKLDFACCLVRAWTSVLLPEAQAEYAQLIFQLCGESLSDPSKSLETFYDRRKKRVAVFSNKNIKRLNYIDMKQPEKPMIWTVETERLAVVVEPLVSSALCKPIFLVGPDGCGKRLIVSNCFVHLKGIQIAVIRCSAQTTAQHVIQKIKQLCQCYTTNTGPVLRPKQGERLVLALEDINLPKPDSYGTVQLHSFLQQIILYQGFYDDDLEWVGIQGIQVVATMNPESSGGRYPVAPRLLAIVNIISISFPSKDCLQLIYSTFFQGILTSPSLSSGPQYDDGRQLSHCTLSAFSKIKRTFQGEGYEHCIFSTRDVTTWACSLLNYSMEAGEGGMAVNVANVLAYEGTRLFADKLPSREDKRKCEKIISEQLVGLGFVSGKEKDEREKPLYVSWFTEWSQTSSGKQKVLKMTTYQTAEKEMKVALLKYSREFRDLEIPLISEVLMWIVRLDRILVRPLGHCLLVGCCGVGRRAAITLAAYMLHFSLQSIHMTKGYSLKSFRNDLRAVLQQVAVQDERIVLLFEDHNFADNKVFLEMVNSLIGSNEIPGLFSLEETEQMMASLQDQARLEGFSGSGHAFFIQRVQNNLRICLIMDERNDAFVTRCQENSAFITSCSVCWFGAWSTDCTKFICKYRLRRVISVLDRDPNCKNFSLHREMLAFHEGMDKSKATPKRFQVFMNTYEAIHAEKGTASSDSLTRLESGLTKFKQVEEEVDGIKQAITEKKNQLQQRQADADMALAKIQQNIETSATQRTHAQQLQESLEVEAKVIVAKKSSAESELSSIQPILDAASEAVGNIKGETLNEIRSLRVPPEPIRDVLEGVLTMLGVADNSWNGMKKFLGERGVKERILSFDASSLTPLVRESVSRLIKQKSQSFRQEIIVRASVAAAPMAAWVHANVEYSIILEKIAPLTQQIAELESAQRRDAEGLKELRDKLEEIDKTVEQLRKGLGVMIKETERLKEEVEAAEEQLKTAQELLGKLLDEKTRWSEDAADIKEKAKLIPRKALLCAAFMTYLTNALEHKRKKLLKKWGEKLGVSADEAIHSMTRFMRTESELLAYRSEGLPTDSLSQENAIAILDATEVPYIVDPANQALEWLSNHLKAQEQTFEVASISQDRFSYTLELAIRFGKTLLVTEVDRIEPVFYPILRHDFVTQGVKKVIQIGNKTIDWQDGFKLYLFSRSSDVPLDPDSESLVTVINFSITHNGLESQLLGMTIQHENPELEVQKVELLQQEDTLVAQLNKLEESLLSDLASSSGDLLQNTQLMDSLNKIKAQSHTVRASLAKSKELQHELDKKRNVYQPFAEKGSVMFFLVEDLERVNRMYQFSLSDFLDLFTNTLEEYESQNNSKDDTIKGDTVEKKINLLSQRLVQKAFLHASKAVFKRHRVEFAMHVVQGLFPSKFPDEYWSVLIGNTLGASDKKKAEAIELPSWAPPRSREGFTLLMALDDIHTILQRWNLQDFNFWNQWVNSASPYEFLRKHRTDLSDVECLMLLAIFRKDKLETAMSQVALAYLQLPVVVEVVTVEAMVAESRPSCPILLITSRGADPSLEVQEMAYKTIGRQHFTQIALGSSRTEESLRQLHRCAASGDWLFLKNLHLVLDWVSQLEKEIVSMVAPHPSFRLFLTTESHEHFPTILLKNSLKMTVESPPGLRQNLLRNYASWSDKSLSQLSTEQSGMLFGLFWFHAVVQERRTYVPQGWTEFYEFTQTDLKAACDILLNATKNENMDWEAVIGLFENAIYGGRLDSIQDVKIMKILLRQIFNEDVLLKFSKPLSKIIDVCKSNDHTVIIRSIFAKMPDADQPSTMELPDNAGRAVQELRAAKILLHLRQLDDTAAIHAISHEALRNLLDPVLVMWRGVGLAVMNKVPTIDTSEMNPDPIYVFFVSELSLLSHIIHKIIGIFVDLERIAHGTILATDELRSYSTSLASGFTPEDWVDLMPGPTSVLPWLQLLKTRAEAMISAFSHPSEYLSCKIKLTQLLRPLTFLNALRQLTARKGKIDMVNLVLAAYPVSCKGTSTQCPVVIVLDGSAFSLQGAVFSGSSLSKAGSETPVLGPFVDVKLMWVLGGTLQGGEGDEEEGYVRVPLYCDAERKRYLFDIKVPCASTAERDQWALCGTAVLLNY